MKKRPTLDDQYRAAKAAYDKAKAHPRSHGAAAAAAILRDLTNRILHRDMRRKKAA